MDDHGLYEMRASVSVGRCSVASSHVIDSIQEWGGSLFLDGTGPRVDIERDRWSETVVSWS